MRPLRVLTRDQLDQFHERGFIVIPDVYPAEAMDRALAASDRLVYGMDFASWSARVLAGETLPLQGAGVSALFATGVGCLDDLVENSTYLDIACDLLGSEDLHYVNGHLFVRGGPSDRRHPEQSWQGYHFDRSGHCFLPPHAEPGAYDFLGSCIFLHDVDHDCAPTTMVDGSHRQLTQLLPRLVREGALHPPGNVVDIRAIPEFSARTSLTAKKGSVAFSSMEVLHAAVPFRDPARQRALWTMSFARQSEALTNRHGNAFSYEQRAQTVPFWTKTTPRVRSLFGWPRPGDPYYTQQTLELLALWYPGMDLSAYHLGLCVEV